MHKQDVNDAWQFLCQSEPRPDDQVRHNLKRYLLAIEWLPDGPARVLELGSNRYFTLLLAHHSPAYQISCAGLKETRGDSVDSGRIDLLAAADKGRFSWASLDVEREAFPYPSASFDLVLNMELIEHVLAHPMQMILEIHRDQLILRNGLIGD